MSITRIVCGGAAALILLGPAASRPVAGPGPQSGQQQPMFRTTTALVEVDFIVQDGRGEFVPGLSAEDVSLFEDGKPQQIQQFYMVSHRGAAAGDETLGAAPPTPNSRGRRVFVLVFDEQHLAHDSLMRVKAGARDFIQRQIVPGDLAGVVVNGSMYKNRLTGSRNELLTAVYAATPVADHRQALLAPFREWPRIPGELDAARIAEGAKEVVDALGVDACNEDPQGCRDQGGVQQVENLIQQKARLYIRQARVAAGRTIDSLQQLVDSLSPIPGRKTIVLLSEGFFVEESRGILQTIAARAARGNTTIYAIDGRGQTMGTSPATDVLSPSGGRSTTFDTGENGPTILADTTGGFVVRSIDDISRAFGLVARDTSTYYVIGYQPDKAALDGKFHKIEVRTRVPGLGIRARKGYVAAAGK